MTDRELLELAAKAAGFDYEEFLPDDDRPVIEQFDAIIKGLWTPLADDGDRYRLIKALRINIDFSDQCAWKRLPNGDLIQEFWHEDGDDADHSLGDEPHAVLRVAAEIGKAMK